eukprot:gene18988-25570_t
MNSSIRSVLHILQNSGKCFLAQEARQGAPALSNLVLIDQSHACPSFDHHSHSRSFADKSRGKQERPESRAIIAAKLASSKAAIKAKQAAAVALTYTTSPLRPLEIVDPRNVSQQMKLTVDGMPLTGDPGSIHYTAPVYIPEAFRVGLPRVLYTDPWTPVEDLALQKKHARDIFNYVKAATDPVTASNVFEGMNAARGAGSLIFGSQEYVKKLLEHLRQSRLLMGQKNPAESLLSHGHPDHPRLYTVLPYQQAEKGSPSFIAQRHAVADKKRIEQGLRRLKNSKPPFRIHRPRFNMSSFQYEMALEAVRQI